MGILDFITGKGKQGPGAGAQGPWTPRIANPTLKYIALAQALEPVGVSVFEVDLQDDCYRAVTVEARKLDSFVIFSRAIGLRVRQVT